MRIKKAGIAIMRKVPIERNRRKPAVLFGRARLEIREKKKALRPKAATGNAVAVPRFLGKFMAATGGQLIAKLNPLDRQIPVFMAPPKPDEPPAPATNVKRQISGRGTDPGPLV